jgi:hypothetical protein
VTDVDAVEWNGSQRKLAGDDAAAKTFLVDGARRRPAKSSAIPISPARCD